MSKRILSKKKEKFVMIRNNLFKMRRGALGAILGALVLLLVVVLVACPAANNAGNGGPGPGPGPGGGTGYICANGTASSDRDATADGLTRCVSCDPLFFALEGSSDVIGSICRTVAEVGEAVRIGMVVDFGVSESAPRDLAAIDRTLYMLGQANRVLYTLNIDSDDTIADGSADQVGSMPAGFGVGELNPTGLAAIDGTLYMVGTTNDVLYTLDTTTGRAILVSATGVSQFGVGEGFPTGLAAIGTTLYMVGDTNGILYTLNIDPDDGTSDDGRAMQVGSTAAGFGVGENPTGLTAIGNTLYMVGVGAAALYTLNIDPADGTDDGRAMQVGTADRFGVGESTPRGLAAIDDILYMTGFSTRALYALRYQ